jgi:hypothetical protein
VIEFSKMSAIATKYVPQVGALVNVRLARRSILARVLEDRGSIGVGGRRLLRIQTITGEPEQPATFEVASDEVVAAPPMTLIQAEEYVARYIVPRPFAEMDTRGRCCVGTQSAPGVDGELRECAASFEDAIERFRRNHRRWVVETDTMRLDSAD